MPFQLDTRWYRSEGIGTRHVRLERTLEIFKNIQNLLRFSILGPLNMGVSQVVEGVEVVQGDSIARRMLQGRDIQQELANRGIVLKAHGNKASVAEEASEAYKDAAEVVEVCHRAGLSLKVARMRPMAVIKG